MRQGPSIDDARAVLERCWGYSSFLPHQERAVQAVLGGRDSLVVLPTGGGKSICFQAPALVLDRLAVVVSPLISLMKDQVDGLRTLGVAADCYHSAMTPGERRAALARLREGRSRLLYVSPERLVGDGGASFLELVRDAAPSYVAIDEAHCISHWGHDFRPEYRLLGGLRELLPGISVHAFTATATEQVRADIAEQLRLVEPEIVVGAFDRPNLVYRVLRRDGLDAQVERVLARHPGEAGIVYCISRREVEETAARLAGRGHRAVPYHAGLDDDLRRRHQDMFSAEQVDVVVATVAFGMGIDRSDVRFVVHAGAPRSLEHYQQEAGRAGRDGLEAECVLIWSGADLALWQRILEGGGQLTPAASRQLADIARYASRVRCRHRSLVEHFGQTLAAAACGACDVCLGELEPVAEATVLAQKILSCVVRVRQSRGAGWVVEVLRGRSNERITAAGHDRLSTFGLLAETPAAELRGHVEQLVDRGLLNRSAGEYPVLSVTEAGWQVLRGDAEVELVRQRRPQRKKGPSTRAGVESWQGVDEVLFEKLRELRRSIAAERGVPPYLVFHDRTLREIARLKPATTGQLRAISGIGERKVVDLGDAVLRTVREHAAGG